MKFLLGLLAVILGVVGCVIVLSSENALVVQPKGMIAKYQLSLIITNILLMLSIIVPTYILLFVVVYKYCLKKDAEYDPNHSSTPLSELLMWISPTIVVIIMAFITWHETHRLDPYKPIASTVRPLLVQVVALDWKWLFIYPEQGIATLNYLFIPDRTPIHFKLAADNSPMNSFWIPQLSGQIYSMAGMITQLNLIADGPGEYVGRAVEINGEGYAGMTFSVKSSSQKAFEDWVAKVKESPLQLTPERYEELIPPFIKRDVVLFSEVENGLFQKIVDKYMYPPVQVL